MDAEQVMGEIRRMVDGGIIPSKRLEQLVSDHEPMVRVERLSDSKLAYICSPSKEFLHSDLVNSGPDCFDARRVKKELLPSQQEFYRELSFYEILLWRNKKKNVPQDMRFTAISKKKIS